MKYADIAIQSPVFKLFTYSFDDAQNISPGMRVEVEFRGKKRIGLCFATSDDPTPGIPPAKIKKISSVLDQKPSFSTAMLKLAEWMSSYYCAPIGEVVRCALPSRMLKSNSPKTTRASSPHEIRPEGGISTLNREQAAASAEIIRSSSDGESRVFLLHGITGSGKTEVYLEIFGEMVSKGRTALLLVPEIGLTPQLTSRAVAKFKDDVAVYHSGLTDAQRHEQWLRIRDGKAKVVIGTRSALFAPLERLGVIVVDEEHDPSFKQDDGFQYNARDAAVMRAKLEGAVAILGSATPSLESLYNVKAGKYSKLEMNSRANFSRLPEITIVDMRAKQKREDRNKSEGNRKKRELCALSPELYDAIEKTLNSGEQTMLFVGRRGFASLIQCAGCGEVIKCPNCDISLALHGNSGKKEKLNCHYCGYSIDAPNTCSVCGSDQISPIGFGTERIEAEITDFFPSAKVARLDSDTVMRSSTRRKILNDMRSGKIDVLIGTQMITKGHDFPDVTLVGVISADLSLSIPDFRSAERTFQLLTQVAGRAGRRNRPGRVIIQTRQPSHLSLVSAKNHDCASFAEAEIAQRIESGYPPFTRLANIRISSTEKKRPGWPPRLPRR